MLINLIKHKKLMMVLAVAWTILIFIGCSLPGKDLPAVSVFDHFDKLVHFVFFFLFSLLWIIALGLGSTKGYFIVVFSCFAYGFFIEWYQINFVPGRSWDVWDGVADGVGGIVGCLFARKML